ncbi:MAG: NAD-dependent epimerase/dehydratase family protein [Actinomycetota bacterium]|nr:NAD-dependent epimerase/dehydratase family protein [Actinomycetota bacterium]
MRVLVTGAAGFIGSAVCQQLYERGLDVVPVDALIAEAHPPSAVAPDRVHRLDVRDAARLQQVMDGVDLVCHQAAMVGAGAGAADLPRYASHNDLGTATLLAVMAERGVDRLVLASSMVVYGEGRYRCLTHGLVEPRPRAEADLQRGQFEVICPRCGRELERVLVEEDAPLRPRSAYAASKVAQEHYASAWTAQVGGRAVALRYHNVYGPWMPPNSPYSGVAAIFRSALERGQPPEVFEDGRQTRDFVHVTDVAQANALALERVVDQPAGSFVAYNVCSGSPVTVLEMAALLCNSMGDQLAGPVPTVSGRFRVSDVRHIVASPARATVELGFSATVPPASGLRGFATAPLRATM